MSLSNNSNSSSSASIPSILVEALHQPESAAEQDTTAAAMMEMGKGKMGLGANAFLLKKMAATGSVNIFSFPLNLPLSLSCSQSFYSPTDTMVSPCTKKLVQSKKRHYTKFVSSLVPSLQPLQSLC